LYQMCIFCMMLYHYLYLKMCHTCETVHQPYSAQKCVRCYLSVVAQAHQGYYLSKYWLVCSHINSIFTMKTKSTVLHFCVSWGQYCFSYCYGNMTDGNWKVKINPVCDSEVIFSICVIL
jgi:hypothetical protein